jgi:hypothetical protein
MLLAVACAGCASFGVPAPPHGWLSRTGPGGPGGDGYGAWVVVRSGFGRDDWLEGELIACRNDSLWVLAEAGLRSKPLRRVRSVHLFKEMDVDGRVREESMSGARQAHLRPWARFPQGFPPGLDRTALRPKPLVRP